MSVDERETVLRSSNRGLEETLRNQLAAHRNVNQRAIDLVKIDLLAGSIAVSGISLSGTSAVVPYLTAATVGFFYAIWSAVRVFRPRHFSRGMGPKEADRIRRELDEGMTADVYHDQVLLTYQEAVASNSEEYLTEAALFGNAVWASVAGLLFASAAAGSVVFSPPAEFAVVVYVLVPAACLWGKERYGFESEGGT